MRMEKKLQNGNVLVGFDSEFGNINVRLGGRDNMYDCYSFLTLDKKHNRFLFNNKVAKEYGIELKIV